MASTGDDAVSEFGAAVAAKFATGAGEPEDHLRTPIEDLIASLGENELNMDIVLAGEDQLSDLRVRPDFAVFADGALIGHIEVKATGKGADPTRFTGAHDRDQWDRLQSLPNLLYTDGNAWAVYREGERVGGTVTLTGDVREAGSELQAPDGFIRTVTDFLRWKPSAPRTARQLAMTAARLCRLLRAEVLELMGTASGLQALASDWRELLFPEATDENFADQYAQTVTFALLLARVEHIDFDDASDIPEVARQLGARHSLIGAALGILTDQRLLERLATSILTLVRVLSVVDWDQISRGSQDLWLLFYEDFLQEYDPELRKESGSYYTPNPVVDAMVNFTDQLVRTRLHRPEGLAAPDVTIVDPACGTGTYLFRIIDRIAATITEREGEGAVPGALTAAAQRLIGLELQTGPYAVAELRLAEELRRLGVPSPARSLRLYVADTLDDPYVEHARLGGIYEPIARSRRAANTVKTDENVVVAIGNPPYREQAKGEGGWIESGNPDKQQEAPLKSFMPPTDWGLSAHVKHLYNLYVYFWRWATWKVFDEGPHNPTPQAGVVTFITMAGFLGGPGHAKMRDYLRRTSDAIWVIYCSPEGHQPPVPTRIFTGVQQPVCITIALRDGSTDNNTPAEVRYHSLEPGFRQSKFQELANLDLEGDDWQTCPSEWRAPFLPGGGQRWRSMPKVEDLFPWHGSGIMPGRTWVVAPDPNILKERWQRLTAASGDRQRELLDEHSDRTIDTVLSDNLYGYPTTDTPLKRETGPCPEPVQIGYRSFDRQWIIPDKRVINRPNPSLWYVRSNRQIYLTALNRTAPENGPAVTFTSLIPDLDHYHGRGGRAFPLWRDPSATDPNVTSDLLRVLSERWAQEVSPEDLFAYVAAVMATSAYPMRFADELTTPGLRVPVTADGELFTRAVEIGRRVLWLHSYGSRFVDPLVGRTEGPPRVEPERRPQLVEPIALDERGMPETISYDEDSRRLRVGAGVVTPVEPSVWGYTVNGMRVVAHWFDYRKKDPAGFGQSPGPLDEVVVERWPAHYTTELLDLLNVVTLLVDLEPSQAELLDDVMASDLVTVDDLKQERVLPVKPTGARRKPSVPETGPQTTFEF